MFYGEQAVFLGCLFVYLYLTKTPGKDGIRGTIKAIS